MTDDDEKTTPAARDPEGENEDLAILAAAESLGRAARACEEGLKLVVTVQKDHRGGALRAATLLLGQLGDLCHEQRRIIAKLRDAHYGIVGW